MFFQLVRPFLANLHSWDILYLYSMAPQKLKIQYKYPKNALLLKVAWEDYVTRRVREGPSGTVAQPNS